MNNEKLTSDLKVGDFFKANGCVLMVLDLEESKDRVLVYVTRADIDQGFIDCLRLPYAWVELVDHPRQPHHDFYLGL